MRKADPDKLTTDWEPCESDSTCHRCGTFVLVRVVRRVAATGLVLSESHVGAKCPKGCWEDEEYEGL
jgi:hypothetical protein